MVAGNTLKVELEISESGHNSDNVTSGNGGICYHKIIQISR